MGDRTTATVTISKRDYDRLCNMKGQLWDKQGFKEYVGAEDFNDYGDTVEFIDYQANYGNWDSLTGILDNESIEYDHRWEDGGDYGAGETFVRIIDGALRSHTLYDTQEDAITHIRNLNELISENKVDEAIKKIKDLHSEYFPFEIKELGRLNSVEFIKEG